MMNRLIWLAMLPALALGACSGTVTPPPASTGGPLPTQEVEMDFEFTSPAFKAGELIPQENTCRGRDISPELHWGEPPAGTKSFAMIMDDPDAPAGTFVHWVIFNIPGPARGLPGALPRDEKLADGTRQGRMSGRDLGYHGPCPPSGTHRYFFKLYALDSLLDLSSSATAEDLRKAMDGHIIARTELMGIAKK